MPLADDIRALRDRVLADLNAAHDYYTDTMIAWDIVEEAVQGGKTFTIPNTLTGTVTTQADLVARAPVYVEVRLPEATFQQFISTFESFLLDFIRLWLLAYPRSLSARQVEFRAILDAADKDAIILLVVNKELNELLYDRPAGWFAYLEEKARLGCPTLGEIERIAEAKASRDLLVHNRGIANRLYEAKAGSLARFRDGERIEIPEPYHRETWNLIRKVVADLSDAAITKIP